MPPPIRPRALRAALALAALVAPAPASPAGEGPTDRELAAAFERLAPKAREEVVEHLRAELRALDTFQLRLLRWLESVPAPDPGLLPLAEPPPIYRAADHAPGQVERRVLAADDPRARRARERILGREPARRLVAARVFDFGRGEVVRLSGADTPERRFACALAGLPPDLDLAEARVAATLAGDTLRAVHAAFGHAYADRAGRVFPGITLYDAWASGLEIEMPDVECLGLHHDLFGDHGTFRSPVAARRQEELYDRLAGPFREARAHRELVLALARTWAQAEPVLPGGYAGQLERLHALWDDVASEPAALAARLPAPADVRDFLADWVARSNAEPALLEAGRRRLRVLRADQARVRATLVRVLREHGALAR